MERRVCWSELLMRRAVLILALAVGCAAMPASAARAGESGGLLGMPSSLEELLIEEAIYLVEMIAQGFTLMEIKVAREDIVGELTTFHVRNVDEMQWDTTLYGHDHRPLESAMDSAEESLAPSVSMAAEMAADGVSFGLPEPSDSQLTLFSRGVASPSPANYPGDYRMRLNNLKNYAVAALRMNESARSKMLNLDGLFTKLNEAADKGVPEGELDGVWGDEYDALNLWAKLHATPVALPYHAATGDENFNYDGADGDMFDTVWGAVNRAGYRRAFQASSLAANVRNAQLSNIRTAAIAAIEADAKFARNAGREEDERREAFGRGIGTWQSLSENTGY
jgi:hypothetical protein